MSATVQEIETADEESQQIVFRLQPVVDLTDDELFELCQVNGELRIERNEDGELIIMPPAGAGSSNRNAEITMQLVAWANKDGTGVAFDSSAGFRLPSRAMRSPDGAWIRHSRWNKLTDDERERFAPICPDFVIELRSYTDRLHALKKKMEGYIENGADFGLLIDPLERKVHVYRRNRETKILDAPKSVSCGPLLKGFTLDLKRIL